MTIPLLSYSYSSQNQRVQGYEVGSEETPIVYNAEKLLDNSDFDVLIRAAYVQIFNEQQLITSNRQTFLESQLRNGQITVKAFIRGLLLSDSFRRRNYEVNNNYRLVQMCIQRVLGREVYGQSETFAWSTVIATKGFKGFVDALLDTQEYLDNFGEDIVPYQRKRILSGRDAGELPFARMPRYGEDYLVKLKDMGYFSNEITTAPYYPPEFAKKIGAAITIAGSVVIGLGAIAIALSAWGFISL